VAIGDAACPPYGLRPALGVLEEVSHVLRRLIDHEAGDHLKACGLAQIQEVDDAPSVGRVRVPEALVGLALVAGSDHRLPSVLGRLRHATSVTKHRSSLGGEGLHNVPPAGKALEEPPVARSEVGVADVDRPRRGQAQNEPCITDIGVGGEGECQARPVARRYADLGLGVGAAARAALKGCLQVRRCSGPGPEDALIGPPSAESEALAVQATVLQAHRPLSTEVGQALALSTDEGLLNNDRRLTTGLPGGESAPHSAHSTRHPAVGLRPQWDTPTAIPGVDPEVAELGGPLPCP